MIKEVSQETLKKIFRNIIKAIIVAVYFIVLNIAYSSIKEERLVKDIEIFASVYLIVGIFFLEMAYKKDDGDSAQTGIEFLILSLHSLSIMHVITLFKYDFRFYLLTSSYIFCIYYVLKSIILYTKGRIEYLHSLSDISDIVKKDKPIKKDAKKRNRKENTEKISTKKEEPEEKVKKATTKKPTVKKTVDEETTIEKPKVKKTIDEKTTTKKATTKKTATKKTTTKNATAEKATTEKATTKKATTKKATTEKPTTKKTTTKKATAKKSTTGTTKKTASK